jgi:2-polyprenyl-3-methyl-5-hydroxy-6-metoxy-1,4-benzoquinol methylase
MAHEADIISAMQREMTSDIHYETEHVACPICGRDEPVRLFHRRENWRIVRCGSCRLVYRNERLKEELDLAHYEKEAFDHINRDWIEGRQSVSLKHLDVIETFRQKNRILDVGAGPGFFLNVCARRGWECHGVEVSHEAVGFAQDNFGLRLMHCSLEAADFPEGSFDVVTLWNVLDQLPRPRAVMEKVWRLLRNGGAVLIRCPNAAFHVPARRISEWLTPAGLIPNNLTTIHLVSFSSATLKRLLGECNYDGIRIRNSSLKWTTVPDAPVGFTRKFICFCAETVSTILFGISRGHLMLAPSLFAVAVKETAQQNQSLRS